MRVSSVEGIRDAYKKQAIAASYFQTRFANELMGLLHGQQVDVVQRIFDQQRPFASLEVAPGPGRITRDLKPTGRLICLEYNSEMIREGKAACKNNAHWIRGDAFQLPFQNEFQLVYTFRFIRHFQQADRQRLYAQIRNVLQPGGILILDAVNEKVSGPLREHDPASYPIYDKLYRDPAELTMELNEGGFDLVELLPVQRWYAMQYRAQVLLGPRNRWLCRKVIRLLEQVRRGPSLEWIITCRRA
jgi:SAM-dependent methyltransferase